MVLDLGKTQNLQKVLSKFLSFFRELGGIWSRGKERDFVLRSILEVGAKYEEVGWKYKGVRREYKELSWKYKEVRWKYKGVRREYEGSTREVQGST